MTPAEAIEFVKTHGVVLESAKGPIPNLAEAVAEAVSQFGEWFQGQLIAR